MHWDSSVSMNDALNKNTCLHSDFVTVVSFVADEQKNTNLHSDFVIGVSFVAYEQKNTNLHSDFVISVSFVADEQKKTNLHSDFVIGVSFVADAVGDGVDHVDLQEVCRSCVGIILQKGGAFE